MRKRRKCNGFAATAFGAGLLIAICFPPKCLVVILSLLIVLCGIRLCKR